MTTELEQLIEPDLHAKQAKLSDNTPAPAPPPAGGDGGSRPDGFGPPGQVIMSYAPHASIWSTPVSKISPVVGLLTGLLIANVACALLLFKLLPEAEASVIPKFEYKVESVADLSFSTEMDALGAQGWEMVAARRAQGSLHDMSYEMIFKRPKAKR